MTLEIISNVQFFYSTASVWKHLMQFYEMSNLKFRKVENSEIDLQCHWY